MAEQEWITQQCQEIEHLDAKHDTLNLHKHIIREAAELFNKKQAGILVDNQGKIKPDTKEKLPKWCNYIKNLFSDNRSEHPEKFSNQGIDITKEEVQHAISLDKTRKASYRSISGLYALDKPNSIVILKIKVILTALKDSKCNFSETLHFAKVENSNMKKFGNQPPITELIENTVSHITKFSWKTSERKNLKLFACGEEDETLSEKDLQSANENNLEDSKIRELDILPKGKVPQLIHNECESLVFVSDSSKGVEKPSQFVDTDIDNNSGDFPEFLRKSKREIKIPQRLN
ncbi:unnamed protein product [Ceutorhynchus assimilis]|uniref:Uncharacterized protein n=1 Tax=Ceutorhynchus assimilis TaxID=467358 RepID=A0A9N9N137_9CUCU|nr:unnamed protein product [Ceutorhynchus assimilis]